VAGERMRTVIGHRDVGTTSCPGDAFYSVLGDVRSTAVAMQEGERSVDPKKSEESKDKGDEDDKKSEDEKSDDEKDEKSKGGEDEKSGDEGSDDGLGAGVEQLSPGVAAD